MKIHQPTVERQGAGPPTGGAAARRASPGYSCEIQPGKRVVGRESPQLIEKSRSGQGNPRKSGLFPLLDLAGPHNRLGPALMNLDRAWGRRRLLSRSYFRAILNRDGRPARCRGSSSRRSGSRFPVRYVLTIIAVALVAVMSAALVAPMLIDWSAHRAEIEARLHAITGANVSLTGPVEVRLLADALSCSRRRLVVRAGPRRPQAVVRLRRGSSSRSSSSRAARSGSRTSASISRC